ncbi:MAG: flagellar hook-associated protein FlgK [Pseudomonadota bacterium]
MSALNIGSRALTANLSALQVIGHNIANVNTEGYSRQNVTMKVSGYQQYANGFFGKGVEVGTVTRSHDAYLTREAQTTRSVASADAVRLARLEQLEAAFPMGEDGIGESLNSMLNAWADVASSPSNQTARLVVIARADELAARLRDTAGQLDILRESTQLQVKGTVDNVNRLAADLAKVNQRLTEVMGSPNTPNDLLDQRDQILSELSKHVQVSSIPGEGGVVSVFVGGSMPLVLGSQSAKLEAGRDPADSARLQISFVQGGVKTPLADGNLGGELGGLMNFLHNDLAQVSNMVGRMALATVSVVNTQHKLGLDLKGQPGGEFFTALNLPTGVQTSGAPGLTASVGVSDHTQFMASDYELRYDGTNYTAVRLSDGTVSAPAAAVPVSFDGLSFNLSGPATAGDVFRFKPFENAAREIKIAITSPDSVAAASPVKVSPEPGNSGGISIESLYANGPPGGASYGTTEVVFAADGSYSIEVGGTPVLTGQTYKPGEPIEYDGWSLTLRGVPADNDTFTVTPAGPNDIRQNAGNAVGFQALRDAAMFEGVPFGDGYVNIFSDVGTRVQSAQFSSAFSGQVAATAENARANVAGVNLDEEAARMLQFQQSYQAAAKFLQVAQSTFDSLLQTVGR